MTFSCYITFPTMFYAIRAESILKNQPFSFKMIPVPRSISSSCGTALRCACEDIVLIKDYLLENDLELEGYYRLEEEGLKTPKVVPLNLDHPEAGENEQRA